MATCKASHSCYKNVHMFPFLKLQLDFPNQICYNYTMRKTPVWASKLLDRIANDEQVFTVKPTIIWRKSVSKWYASGHFYPSWDIPRIVVTTGKSGISHARSVLVHEIAHWLTPGCNHNNCFQDINYRLQRKYGSIKIEVTYRTGS